MLLLSAAWARPSTLPPLTLAQQETELAVLRQALTELHPGLHLYIDPEALDAAFAEARGGFAPGATALDLYADLLPVVAAVGDTHTRLSLSDEVRDALGDTLFPLDLVVVGDRLWVDPRAHRGPVRELISVEGRPADTLLAELRARVGSDGHALARKDAALDTGAGVLLTALLGARETWTLETRPAGGEPRTEVLAGVRWTRRPEADAPRRHPFVDRSAGRIEVVPVAGFAGGDGGSRRAAARMRRRGRRADALVLDLRDDGGGRTLSLLELWGAFAERPLRPYVLGWTRRADHGWPSAAPGELPEGAPAEAFRAGPGDLYPPVVPDPDGVRVPVVVVVDGTTGSSASDLAWFFQSEGRGALVGSETASGRWLQSCERSELVILRESWLLLSVPLIALATSDTEGRGHGVVPEHAVAPTIDDLAAGRDVVLERALAVARGLVGAAP